MQMVFLSFILPSQLSLVQSPASSNKHTFILQVWNGQAW